MTSQEICDLYRDIGRTFLDLGVSRVYLVHSKALIDSDYEMEMDIVLDTEKKVEAFVSTAKERWPQIIMNVSRLMDVMRVDKTLVEDAITLG